MAVQLWNKIEKLAGTTIKPTFVSSGVTASPISSALLDRSEVLVNSIAAVSSGNGHYYGFHLLPNSSCWLINEWRATIEGHSYIERQFVRVVWPEVD
jgi:hypothetical protein